MRREHTRDTPIALALAPARDFAAAAHGKALALISAGRRRWSRRSVARLVNAMRLDTPFASRLPTASGAGPFPTASVLLPRAVRVLMIDDDADWRACLTELLREERFEVETAVNGLEGLRRLQGATPPPQVVLLDLEMPVMDGREFLARTRQDPALRAIPVVVLSSAARDGLPAAVALDKACDPHALVGVLRSIAS